MARVLGGELDMPDEEKLLDRGHAARLVIGSFVAASGGALLTALISVPVQIGNLEGRMGIARAEIAGRLEAVVNLKGEMRSVIREHTGQIAALTTRLSVLENQKKVCAWGIPQLPRIPIRYPGLHAESSDRGR